MLRDFCMQEAVFGDAEGDDPIRVVLWVVGVRGTGFHDGFDGVGDHVRDTPV